MLAHVLEGSVMDPKARDSIRICTPGEDALGLLNPDHQGPVFPPVTLYQPELEPLLSALNVSEDAKLKIATAQSGSGQGKSGQKPPKFFTLIIMYFPSQVSRITKQSLSIGLFTVLCPQFDSFSHTIRIFSKTIRTFKKIPS